MEKINKYFPDVYFHPGETLEEKLKELGMGPKEFAVRTGKPEKTIIAVLKGESSITPDMSIQFESVLSIPARFWLKSQLEYDEYLARERRKEVLLAAIEWVKLFPIPQMVKLGWIKPVENKFELAPQLLSFFGVASAKSWEDYYLNQTLKVAFRISLAHVSEPYAVSAWLRHGEITSMKLNAESYSEKRFNEVLPEIKSIMTSQPDNFFHRLQTLCLSAGVKVVYSPCVSKAPINGATRWINGVPVIQLSGRYKRNDIFWLTFFHEAGHILLHGSKEIFLECNCKENYESEKENEADEFAIKWTFSHAEEDLLMTNFRIDDDIISEYAHIFNTHPALIVGRLQHKKLLRCDIGRKFIESIELK